MRNLVSESWPHSTWHKKLHSPFKQGELFQALRSATAEDLSL